MLAAVSDRLWKTSGTNSALMLLVLTLNHDHPSVRLFAYSKPMQSGIRSPARMWHSPCTWASSFGKRLLDLIRNVGRSCRRFILLDLVVRHPLPLALFRLVPFVYQECRRVVVLRFL
jgi:hypothetical protein